MGSLHLLIVGGVCLVCAAVLFYYYIRSKQILDEMWAVKTYDAAELKRMCTDRFDAVVEVEGAVSCEKPVMSFVTQVPCCWLRVRIWREQSRSRGALVSSLASLGDRKLDQQHSDWIEEMDRTFCAVFRVEDKTGSTLVYPESADVESTVIFDGVVSRDISWLERLLAPDAGRYHVKEEAFLATGYAYVLGQATRTGDDVMLHYPKRGYIDPDHPHFVISRKTEKELAGYKSITTRVCLSFGALLFLASVFLILAGLGVVDVGLLPG